ncbi:hypothetical protein B0I35DRAFT_221312 [Stachybotrys elegans]|uniref:Uncharacterized protein n=1 Tax=Stachybotrys elegans TaxID=80388 RepID=A0A8K0SR70_9HYPO|nr:hypothetical protein B0I35DRAFT_221312 [Stachybotrys elegans]
MHSPHNCRVSKHFVIFCFFFFFFLFCRPLPLLSNLILTLFFSSFFLLGLFGVLSFGFWGFFFVVLVVDSSSSRKEMIE